MTQYTHSPVAGLRKKLDADSGALVDIVDQNGASVWPAVTSFLVSGGGNRRKIGTRVLHHRFGTFNDASLNTHHVAAEMATQFDAVRLILANTDTTSARYFSCSISVLSSAADLNNSGGTWLQAGQGIDSTVTVPNAVKSSGGSRVTYAVSNWVQIASLARSDGGTYPLVAVRARNLEGNAALPVYGNGTDDLTNWATRSTGRLWCARNQAVDGITTPANFTSTTNVSQSPIVGIQYIARGRVLTLMGCSDSIGNGRGTYIGEGYGMPAADALQQQIGIPIEYADCSWAGQNSGNTNGTGYDFRALDIMRGPLKPDILFAAVGSPNDISTTITQALVDRMRYMRELVVAEAGERGVALMLPAWMPSNYSIKQYGATDSLRLAYNAECAAAYGLTSAGRVAFVDLATPLNGGTNNSQIEMNAVYTTDGIHPNDIGNAALQPYVQSTLRQLIGSF